MEVKVISNPSEHVNKAMLLENHAKNNLDKSRSDDTEYDTIKIIKIQ